MSRTNDIVIPTIHLNGTSGDQLRDIYRDAYRSVSAAIDAMYAAGPNARDYYVQGDGAFQRAQKQHSAQVDALLEVQRQLAEIRENIQDQLDQRSTS